MEENNMQSPKKVICCKLKDTEKLMASQSGGAFTAIATAFLKCGGIVYGCEMDNSNQAERFVLVSAGLNATRDHYLSTTFLAICLFVYTLKSNWHNKGLAVIGRKCSTWLYIIHPIFITAFSVATGKLGIKSIYRCVAPIVTYCATLTFLIVMCRLKSLLVKNNQRK